MNDVYIFIPAWISEWIKEIFYTPNLTHVMAQREKDTGMERG